jgi:hypothetical protein
MSARANVRSVDAIRDFREGVGHFIDDASAALLEVDATAQRLLMWLRLDRMGHWTREVRHRTELVTRAKSLVMRRKMTSFTEAAPSAIEEELILEGAKRKLAEAQVKLEATRKWVRVLERETMLCKAQCQGLARSLDGDLPGAVGKLARMIESLEAYAALAPPTEGGERLPVEAETPPLPEPGAGTPGREAAG